MTYDNFEESTMPGPSAAGGCRDPRHRRLGPVFWLLLVLFIELELADIVTTNHGLAISGSGAWEANPIMSAFQSQLGTAWWLPKALAAAWVAVAATCIRRRWPLVLAVSYCGIVVAINLAS